MYGEVVGGHVCKLGGYLHDKDQAGFHQHLKKMEMGGNTCASAECAKSEDGRSLKVVEIIQAL